MLKIIGTLTVVVLLVIVLVMWVAPSSKELAANTRELIDQKIKEAASDVEDRLSVQKIEDEARKEIHQFKLDLIQAKVSLGKGKRQIESWKEHKTQNDAELKKAQDGVVRGLNWIETAEEGELYKGQFTKEEITREALSLSKQIPILEEASQVIGNSVKIAEQEIASQRREISDYDKKIKEQEIQLETEAMKAKVRESLRGMQLSLARSDFGEISSRSLDILKDRNENYEIRASVLTENRGATGILTEDDNTNELEELRNMRAKILGNKTQDITPATSPIIEQVTEESAAAALTN